MHLKKSTNLSCWVTLLMNEHPVSYIWLILIMIVWQRWSDSTPFDCTARFQNEKPRIVNFLLLMSAKYPSSLIKHFTCNAVSCSIDLTDEASLINMSSVLYSAQQKSKWFLPFGLYRLAFDIRRWNRKIYIVSILLQ